MPLLKPGFKYRYLKSLWHVVTVFTDNGEEMVVVKSWAKYKRIWIYDVIHKETLIWYLTNHK